MRRVIKTVLSHIRLKGPSEVVEKMQLNKRKILINL